MTEQELHEMVQAAVARFDALTPEQQREHRLAQQQSFVRSIVEWPKPKFRWEHGAKVYESFEDYCND
jgi:hypothetical protein